MGGINPVISTNVKLRRDGLPYAGQREPDDKAVAVYFTYNRVPMCFACDQWDRLKDNMQAIHKTIEALRGIERWGSGDMMQQAFQGFVALPAPAKPHDVLGVPIGASEADIVAAWRERAKRCHPDNGGDADEFQRITAAKNALLKGTV